MFAGFALLVWIYVVIYLDFGVLGGLLFYFDLLLWV